MDSSMIETLKQKYNTFLHTEIGRECLQEMKDIRRNKTLKTQEEHHRMYNKLPSYIKELMTTTTLIPIAIPHQCHTNCEVLSDDTIKRVGCYIMDVFDDNHIVFCSHSVLSYGGEYYDVTKDYTSNASTKYIIPFPNLLGKEVNRFIYENYEDCKNIVMPIVDEDNDSHIEVYIRLCKLVNRIVKTSNVKKGEWTILTPQSVCNLMSSIREAYYNRDDDIVIGLVKLHRLMV